MSETKQMLKNAMILFIITLVAGALLGIVYQVTKAPIAYQEQLAQTKANQEVFPDADSFADPNRFLKNDVTPMVFYS